MRLKPRWAGPLAMAGFLAFSGAIHATSCTTQAEMSAPDRDALAAMGQRLATAVVQQDLGTLQSSLLPDVASQWDGIRQAVGEQRPGGEGRPGAVAEYLCTGRNLAHSACGYAVFLFQRQRLHDSDHHAAAIASGQIRIGSG